MPQPAWLVYGPAGYGKTTWILSQAKQAKQKIYHWNARTDRTLREGRETLHRQVRSQEPLFVWIEGADDLTPEAQAFLRRILETHASDILFILECRDAGRLQEPIRSRCIIRKMYQPTWIELHDYLKEFNCIDIEEIKEYLKKNEYSYRRAKQCIILKLQYPDIWQQTIEHRKKENLILKSQSANDLITYIKSGYNPENLINEHLSNEILLKDYGKCTEISGSLWAFLGSALYNPTTTPQKEEE